MCIRFFVLFCVVSLSRYSCVVFPLRVLASVLWYTVEEVH